MRFGSLTAALAAMALSLGLMSGAQAVDDPDGATTEAPATGTGAAAAEAVAEQALTDAEALLDSDPVTVPETGRDATMALRDLVLHRDQLSARQQATADRLVARPGSNRRVCARHICVHWKTTGRNASKPAYARKVLTTMEHVHRTYVKAGYRAPKKDGKRGGNAKRDIYLSDLGAGLYGWCTTDQQNVGPPWQAFAFCSLDNDYAPSQFGNRNTPLENMRVTAAHEYFHAVQYAYDLGEDGWFMESTATWAEDEVYDGVDDNRQYLRSGQMGRPRAPMDEANFGAYGQWIFFRYLTERMTSSKGGLPTLVRDMWRAAQYTSARDRYSLQAISNVLGKRDKTFGRTFAAFSEANRRPDRAYAEGASYPRASAFASPKLSRDQTSTGWKTVRLDHLTSATAAFRRGDIDTGWKLRVEADLAPSVRGSRAVLTVHRATGAPSVKHIGLDQDGDGQLTVSFGRSVERVEVTLVNASTRTTCGTTKGGGRWSCAGNPTDDDLSQRVKATAFN
jgi:hypothetical protein